MVRDATARLYDVDQHRTVLKRLTFENKKYELGEVVFQAKKGRSVDLEKLHESLWATRLSGGTRSGVLSLEVTVLGEVSVEEKQTMLRPPGSSPPFVLVGDPDAKTRRGCEDEVRGNA